MGAGTAYYNEHDKFAAAWLRELIADGLIAPGEVDERSIEDVLPSDLAGFVQCHFFAGIGIWSLALRQAGWRDDEPIWTGSCPCQPFSAAGKGGGFADERHLWPAFHWLIEQCGPELVLGEQVASKDGLAWLDLVSADVETSGYAFGAADTCAAGFGAPHIRQRLYWMADATRELDHGAGNAGPGWRREHSDSGAACRLADADDTRPQGHRRPLDQHDSFGRADQRRHGAESGVHGGLADTGRGLLQHQHQQRLGDDTGRAGLSQEETRQLERSRTGNCDGRSVGRVADAGRKRCDGEPVFLQRRGQVEALPEATGRSTATSPRPGPLNGLWRDADWLCCTDGKWRPVAPGTFPLAPTGAVRNRVGLLRGAGNAINLAQAQGFVEAVIEVRRAAESLAA